MDGALSVAGASLFRNSRRFPSPEKPFSRGAIPPFLLFQSVLAKTCVKLLCEDPAFSEYIKCILMDERTFLNNNVAYSFLTCFLHKVEPVKKQLISAGSDVCGVSAL